MHEFKMAHVCMITHRKGGCSEQNWGVNSTQRNKQVKKRMDREAWQGEGLGHGHGPVQDLERVNRTGPISTPYINTFLGFANHFNSILVPLGQRRYSLFFVLSFFQNNI
jgi:hypothetical protein